MSSVTVYLLMLGATACCIALVPVARRISEAIGAVDRPGGRRQHNGAVPRLGGTAIFITTALVVTSWFFACSRVGEGGEANPQGLATFALAASLVFFVGLVDDIRGLKPRHKLLFQVCAAMGVVAGGGQLQGVGVGAHVLDLGLLAVPFSVLWIVVVTNAVNLLDGLDGLATGIALLALGALLALAKPDHYLATGVAAILLGASAGFLFFNIHPASIFLGDSGSLFLGFSIAVLSVYGGTGEGRVLTPVTLLILTVPLLDLVWAVARRYVKGLVPLSLRSHLGAGARLCIPDARHLHHRLLHLGLKPREAMCLLYVIQALLCGGALYLQSNGPRDRPAAHVAHPAPRGSDRASLESAQAHAGRALARSTGRSASGSSQ